MATKNGGVSMMRFISYCSSKCYENTDGQPGGHRSRRGRGPRMAWPPSAVLEGGAHKRSAVGRIAPKGRTSRGPLPAGDRPTCESVPFRPDAIRQRPAVTCGRTKRADIVPAQGRQNLRENGKGRYRSAGGAEGYFVRRGGRSHPGGVRPRWAHPGGSEQQEL